MMAASNETVLDSLDYVRRQLAERPQRFEQDVMDTMRPQLTSMAERIHMVDAQIKITVGALDKERPPEGPDPG